MKMRNCHFLSLLVLLSLVLATAALVSAQSEPDSLWTKAVTLYDANSNWVPGSIYMHMQEVDKHGEPKNNKGHEVWTRLFLNEEGEVDTELIKMLDDGEDVTEEEKEKREEEEDDDDDRNSVTMEGYIPFDPEHQGGVTITRTGDEDVVDGRRYAVYEFEDERDPEDDDDEEMTVKGKVWLDVETGAPLRMVYTTDPLPKRVKKMVTSVTYEYEGPDAWNAATMSVKATGGILFIKKHFRMNMTFDEYWRMPEEEDETHSAQE
jgi:hypothetical protein